MAWAKKRRATHRTPFKRRRVRLAVDPPTFDLWSKQQEILDCVNTKRRTAIAASHGLGKTHTAAVAIVNWVMNPAHPRVDTLAVVLAPSHNQLREGVFRHLYNLRSKGLIPGEVSTQGKTWKVNGHTVAFGYSPPTTGKGDTLQGVHAPYLLVIYDEACGIEAAQWDAALSWASSADNRMLAIGNPTDRETRFGDACESPETPWHVLRLPYDCAPAFTGESVSDRILNALPSVEAVRDWEKEWNAANCAARLYAQFPTHAQLAIFNLQDDFTLDDADPPVTADTIGLDVAGPGRDATVAYARKDNLVWPLLVDGLPKVNDPAYAAQLLAPVINNMGVRTVNVDGFGVGATAVGPLTQLCPQANVRAVMTGQPARDSETYFNTRAEMHWTAKLGGYTVVRPTEALKGEIRGVRQHLAGEDRRRQVEPKAKLKQRIGRSPDDLDAMLLAIASTPEPKIWSIGDEQ